MTVEDAEHGDGEADKHAEDLALITKPGDLWILGEHRILCGDALKPESYLRLLGDERAQMVFTDPPWNIPIAGNVSGLGALLVSARAIVTAGLAKEVDAVNRQAAVM